MGVKYFGSIETAVLTPIAAPAREKAKRGQEKAKNDRSKRDQTLRQNRSKRHQLQSQTRA